MSTFAITDAAKTFVEQVWNAPDGVTRLGRWLSSDYRDHAYSGDREGLARAIAELRDAFPDAIFEIEGVLSEGSCTSLRMMLRATHTGAFRGQPATGRSIEVKVFRWLRFEGNRIAEHWALLDTASLLRQLNS